MALWRTSDRDPATGEVRSPASISLFDLETGAERRLVLTTAENSYPIWSPDGEWIYFVSRNAEEAEGVFRQRPQVNTETPERVMEGWAIPLDVSADGKHLLFYQSMDMGTVRLDQPEDPQMIIDSELLEIDGRRFPDRLCLGRNR